MLHVQSWTSSVSDRRLTRVDRFDFGFKNSFLLMSSITGFCLIDEPMCVHFVVYRELTTFLSGSIISNI